MHYLFAAGRGIYHGLFLSLFLAGLILTFSVTIGSGETKAPDKIDLNTASEKQLESIKGVGPVSAKKIVASRPYSSVEDLSKAGIPEKTIEKMKPFVAVGKSVTSPSPASPSVKAAPPSPPSADTRQTSRPGVAKGQSAKAPAGQRININTASKEQLEALPGIGPVKAQAIIDGRPYGKTEDIMKVKGIKEGTFNKIKDSITVG